MTEVRSAYETGRGVVRMRATAEIGALPRGKSSITVTELPYGVGPERVTAKVAELDKAKKLQGIADINDYSDGSVGLQLVIEVKAGFNPQAVLGELYRLTPLEESFGINNVALVDGPAAHARAQGAAAGLPRPPGRRRHPPHPLPAAQGAGARAPGRGPAIALDAIDEVVRIIRASQDTTEARAELVRTGRADRRPGRLRPRDAAAPARRAGGREAATPSSPSCARRSPSSRRSWRPGRAARRSSPTSWREIAREHGSPRRTVLVGGDLKALVTARSASLEVADDPVDVLLSSAGLLARTPVPRSEGRAERQAAPARRRRVSAVRSTARGQVGAVTSAGRVLRVGVLDLPEVPGVTTGALSLRGGAPGRRVRRAGEGRAGPRAHDVRPGLDRAGAGDPARHGEAGRAGVAGPARGRRGHRAPAGRRGRRRGRAGRRRGGARAVHLDGDLLRFPASAVRPQGRSAGGLAGVKLAPGAVVVGFSAVALTGGDTLFEEPVVVTGGGLPPERGKGPGTVSSVKVTPLSEYPRKGRATGGVRVQRLLSGEARLVLGWAGPRPPGPPPPAATRSAARDARAPRRLGDAGRDPTRRRGTPAPGLTRPLIARAGSR